MCVCYCRSCIFYRACMDIPRGTELLVCYNDSYTSFFGIPLQCIAQDENCKKTLLTFLFFSFLFFSFIFLSLPPLCWTSCIFDEHQFQNGSSRNSPWFLGLMPNSNTIVTVISPYCLYQNSIRSQVWFLEQMKCPWARKWNIHCIVRKKCPQWQEVISRLEIKEDTDGW